MGLTFDRLRQENARDIAAREAVAAQAQALIDGGAVDRERANALARMRCARRRIADVLEPRGKRIDRMSSSQPQIDEYGEGRWRSDFVRLSDVTATESVRRTQDSVRAEIWNALPYSLFRRFQEAFSRGDQLAVPSRGIDANGRPALMRTVDFTRLGIEGCLVSADRIPDKLASDLRIVDFGEDDSPLDRLEKKANPAVVRSLKEVFSSAKPLANGNLRMFVTEPGRNNAGGALLYLSEDVNGNGSAAEFHPKKLKVQYFSDAFSALRKTRHEAAAHWREMNALTDIRLDIERLIAVLNSEWRRDTPQARKDELRTSAAEGITRCRAQLERCRNAHKVEVRDVLADIEDLTDASGKVNVSASMAKLVRCIAEVGRRFEETDPIGGCNQSDRMALERAIADQSGRLERFAGSMRSGERVLRPRSALLDGQELSASSVEQNVGGMWRRIGADEASLHSVTLQPLRRFADAQKDSAASLRSALSRRSRDEALVAAAQSQRADALLSVRLGIESLKSMAGDGARFSEASAAAQTDRTIASFESKMPDGTLDRSGGDAECIAVRDRLTQVALRLRRYAEERPTEDERAKMLKRFRKHLDTFDVESLLPSASR